MRLLSTLESMTNRVAADFIQKYFVNGNDEQGLQFLLDCSAITLVIEARQLFGSSLLNLEECLQEQEQLSGKLHGTNTLCIATLMSCPKIYLMDG